jgi:phosphoglycolate phosphatase-like HAD superfamily hydrolase
MEPNDLARLPGDFASVLSAITNRGYRLVCFDFGGTLLDFTPLHVRGFFDALGISEDSDCAQVVGRTVHAALVRGLDSFEMTRMIADALSWPADFDLNAVVLKKRSLVETYLRNTKLDEFVNIFLIQLLKLSSVAVISLGHIDSMKTVLNRSLGTKAGLIAVYGRHSASERVEKHQLLRRAIEDAGVPLRQVVYVGDADVDESIALYVGIDSIRVRPFHH